MSTLQNPTNNITSERGRNQCNADNKRVRASFVGQQSVGLENFESDLPSQIWYGKDVAGDIQGVGGENKLA